MIVDTSFKPSYQAPVKIHVAYAIQKFLIGNKFCRSAADKTRVDKGEYYALVKAFCFQHPKFIKKVASGIEARELFIHKNMLAFMLFAKETLKQV